MLIIIRRTGKRQIGVVQRALLAGDAKARVGRFAAQQRLRDFLWFGMMTMKTLAAMMVPMKAPTWISAPRPENTWVKP